MKGETVSDNSNANGSTPTILLVDDEEMVLNSIKSFFAIESDYQLAAYTSPTQALQEIEQTHFDLVISDYLMPEMDGITFAKKIRFVLPDMPIMLMTGDVSEELREQALSLGRVAFLEKPFPLEQTLRVEVPKFLGIETA